MRALWLLPLLLLSLAGCAEEPPDDGTAETTTETPTGEANTYPDHRAFGDPERVEGTVSVVEREDGTWRAEQEVLIVNGFGEATRSTVAVQTFDGAVAVGGLDVGVYALRVRLWAEGETEAAAEALLGEVKVQHSDGLAAGGLHLNASLDAPASVHAGASFILALPSFAIHDVSAVSEGGVVVSGLDASRLWVRAGGAVSAGGRFDAVDIQSDGPAKFHAGRLGPGATEWRLDCASVSAELTEGSYDLTADGATISVDLNGTELVGEQTEGHAHVRSPGFATAPSATTVHLTADGTVRVTG